MTEGYPREWQADVSADGAHAAAPVQFLDTESASDEDAEQGKAGAAKEQAAQLGQGAAEAGQHVVGVATDQASNVVAEAGSQAKDLMSQARSELTDQAGVQQDRLASSLRALGDELESMSHHSDQPGVATDLVKQASTRAHDVASWLDSREPGHVVQEVQDFARRSPAAFLAIAAGAGLLAGRMGRGVKDAGSDSTPATDASAAVTPSAATPNVATTPFESDDVRAFASSQPEGYHEYRVSGEGL